MENVVNLALEKLENIKNINDLSMKTLYLQNLAYFLLQNQNKLKIELNYPLFWYNLENLVVNSLLHQNSYETELNYESRKIILQNRASFTSYEADLITPADLVDYLTTEDIPPRDKQILEIFCSHSALYISLNLILNLPE
jgi:uncharacterized protein YcfL